MHIYLFQTISKLKKSYNSFEIFWEHLTHCNGSHFTFMKRFMKRNFIYWVSWEDTELDEVLTVKT